MLPEAFSFNQLISIRLDEKGETFHDSEGNVSFYGPGHGDFRPAFVNSGMLDKFIENGGEYLFFYPTIYIDGMAL